MLTRVRIDGPTPRPRIPAAAKRTAVVNVRLTRAEAQAVGRRAATHDPPTVAAWCRAVIVAAARDPSGKPPA